MTVVRRRERNQGRSAPGSRFDRDAADCAARGRHLEVAFLSRYTSPKEVLSSGRGHDSYCPKMSLMLAIPSSRLPSTTGRCR